MRQMRCVLILLAVAVMFAVACSGPAVTPQDNVSSSQPAGQPVSLETGNTKNETVSKAEVVVEALLKADDYDKAIGEARAALAANPSDALREKLADAYMARGWFYKTKRLTTYTLRDLLSAKEAAPGYYLAYYDLGRFYNNQVMQLAGIWELTECIGLKPDFAPAYNERSACESRIYRWEEALSDAGKAISLNPQEPVFYYTRSLAYRGLGRIQEAVADLEMVLKLPGDAVLKDKANADLKGLKP